MTDVSLNFIGDDQRLAIAAAGRAAGSEAAAAASAVSATNSASLLANFLAAAKTSMAQMKADLLFLSGLTPGSIGVWFADQYLSTSRKVIPNMLATVPPSDNLFGSPRSNFAGSLTPWRNAGLAVTDNNATDWSGLANTASTFIGSGFWYSAPKGFDSGGGGSASLPAGRYMMAAWVRRAAAVGSNQQFRMSEFTRSLHSGTLTATSTWQRFTFTFDWATPGSPLMMPLRSFDDATGASLEVSDVHLFTATGVALGTTVNPLSTVSDPGATELPVGHMYVGYSNSDPGPSVASGVFDQSNNGYGVIQFAKAQTLSAFTVLAVFQKTASTSGYQSVLSNVQSPPATGATINASPEIDSGIFFQAGGPLSKNLFAPATDLNRWQAWHETYDGTTDVIGLSGIPIDGFVQAAVTRNIQTLYSGVAQNFSEGKLAAVLLWPRALTPAELASNLASIKTRIANSGITLPKRKIYIAEGHSIPAGVVLSDIPGTCYTYQQGPNASPQINGAVYAVSGDSMPQLKARLPKLLALIDAAVAQGIQPIISVMIGRNDFTLGTTPTAFCADLSINWLDVVRARGAYVILETQLPAVALNFTTWRTTVNTTFRGWVGAYGVAGKYCNALMDWDTVTGIGGNADAGTVDSVASPTGTGPATTNYLDGTHPNAAGNAVMRPYLTTLINAAVG